MKLKPFFLKGIRWQVGDGKNIDFWKSNWAFASPITDLISNPLPQVSHKVSDFINEDKQWDEAKLGQFLTPCLSAKIMSIPIPRNNIPDKFFWGPDPSGSFTTKSAACLIQGFSLDHDHKVKFN